ncbi:MAG: hypothetical protein FJ095_19850 [Deltaproteobacteria bacterium]|nr:hypothetical protein [Deltaproteobacteria bacterium]
MTLGVINTLVTLVTLVIVVVAMFIAFKFVGGLGKESQQNDLLLRTGMPGTARVLFLQSTGMSVKVMGQRSLRLGIGLEVHLPGRAPYQVQIQPLVSEIYIASIQPGATVAVAVDQQNPMNVAIALGQALHAPAAPGASWQHPGLGGPAARGVAGYPAAPGAAVPVLGQPGWGPAPPAAPMGMSPGMSGQNLANAKRFMLIMFVVTTVPVFGILLAVFVDWSSLFGGENAPDGGYCKAAARCCEVVSGPVAKSVCENLEDLPGVGCKMSYEQYKDQAARVGKKCE